jgi:hypothetical protein
VTLETAPRTMSSMQTTSTASANIVITVNDTGRSSAS